MSNLVKLNGMIREWETTNNNERIGIIALTASILRESIERFLLSECDCHLGKPFDKSMLMKVMFAVINGQKCIL